MPGTTPFQPLLVIEDSDEDLAVLLRALREIGFTRPVLHHSDAARALELLKAGVLSPAVVLLDLNLPGLGGRSFLQQLKAEEKLKPMPVVVFSTSDNPGDIEFCYRNGASGFVTKLMDMELQRNALRTIAEYWFQTVHLAHRNRAG